MFNFLKVDGIYFPVLIQPTTPSDFILCAVTEVST